MKNLKLAVAAMALITVSSVVAQDVATINKTDFRSKITFGAKVGFNKSNIYSTQGDAFESDYKYGLAFGAFVAIPIGKIIGLQPEISFSQKGFQASTTVLGINYKFTRTSNYVDVPLLFCVNASEFITLQAGPQYSYLLKQRDEFGTTSSSVVNITDFENNNVRKNVLGFMAGFGINIKHVVLSGRAGWDIQNNNGNGTSTNPRYKNLAYQATIGYRFYTAD